MNYEEEDLFPRNSRIRTPVQELPVGGVYHNSLPVPYTEDKTLAEQMYANNEPTLEEIARAAAEAEAKRKAANQQEGFTGSLSGFAFYKKNGSYVFEMPESIIFLFLLALILILLIQMMFNSKRVIIIEKDSSGREITRRET